MPKLLNTLKFILNHPINKRQRIKALVRYFKWQIGSRLIPGSALYDWIDNSKLIIKAGETGLTGNVYCGLHEFIEMSFVLHVLDSDSVFIDVGTNAGSYTILACAVAGSIGYAFEPIPSTFSRLMQNVYVNNLFEKVKCFNIGLGDQEDVLLFTSDHDTTNHIVVAGEENENVIKVKVRPLNNVVPKNELPSLMKIDAEGYEYPILRGADEILGKTSLHSVILELNGSENRYGFREENIVELLSKYGFKPFSYDPFVRVIYPVAKTNLCSGNAIFIRDTACVVKKVRESKKYCINNVYI